MNKGTNLLWYRQSAATWNEALPLGNGRIGAMVYGDACHERISLNEDTLWSGIPTYYELPNGVNIFKEARRLALERRYLEAQTLLEQEFTNHWSQQYLPLGELRFDMEHPGEVENFKRVLDISTGIHTVEYDCAGVHYTRECFISNPDQVMAVRLTADQPSMITFTMALIPALKAFSEMKDSTISISGNCPVCWRKFDSENEDWESLEYGLTNENKGIGYFAQVRTAAIGGRIHHRGGLRVEKADSIIVYFNVRTSFNGWDKHPVLEGKPYIEPCLSELDHAGKKSYEQLKEAHIADHAALYGRVSLDLGGGEEHSTLQQMNGYIATRQAERTLRSIHSISTLAGI